VKQTQQLASSDDFPLRKLRIADACVWLETDAADNPLACVPAKVQNQIADAVRFFVGTPPDLLVRQLLEAAFNFW
jgi:hypothetical protein